MGNRGGCRSCRYGSRDSVRRYGIRGRVRPDRSRSWSIYYGGLEVYGNLVQGLAGVGDGLVRYHRWRCFDGRSQCFGKLLGTSGDTLGRYLYLYLGDLDRTNLKVVMRCYLRSLTTTLKKTVFDYTVTQLQQLLLRR